MPRPWRNINRVGPGAASVTTPGRPRLGAPGRTWRRQVGARSAAAHAAAADAGRYIGGMPACLISRTARAPACGHWRHQLGCGAALVAALLAVAWASAAAAQERPTAAPADAALPYSAAVAARFPPPALRYDVAALADGAQAYTGSTELSAWFARLATTPQTASAGTHIERLQPGRSVDGTPIEVLRFSRGGSGGKRPLVLLVGQQHGDEPAGAEALLIVARALAGGEGARTLALGEAGAVLALAELASVLDHIDVLVLPRANPDGAVLQRRVNAAGMDINRDHLLLRTPEARALAALVRSQRPVVVVDAHEHSVVGRYLEKFNAVQRHDMLLQYAMTANLPEVLGRASEQWFRQPLLEALAADGLSVDWYYTNPLAPSVLRLAMGGVQPDTVRNVNGLRNAVSLLLESRGVGIGRLHLARRVHSQVLALATVLRQAALHADELVALQAAADAEVAAAACGGRAVVAAQATPGRRVMLMLDPVSGADKPVEVDWDSSLTLRVRSERQRPCGYWLAADQRAAVDTLSALGVQLQRLAGPAQVLSEAWVETARGEVPRPDVLGVAADGQRSILQLVVDLRLETTDLPAGSWYVPLDQPLANLAIAALEPDTQNSFIANRLIDRLDAVRRLLARPPAGLLAWPPGQLAPSN